MSASDDTRLRDEIDKISRDVKRIMAKVEEMYPSKTAEPGPENTPEDDNPESTDDSPGQ